MLYSLIQRGIEIEANSLLIQPKADVAQLVEQSIRNRQVIGSSPIVGSIPSPPGLKPNFSLTISQDSRPGLISFHPFGAGHKPGPAAASPKSMGPNRRLPYLIRNR